MYNSLISISIYAILIFILLYKIKFKSNNNEFISKDTTMYLKGYSIVIIAIHHFCLNISNPGILFVFTKIGYLGVSVFLFLSGYGIAKSFQKKGLNNFIAKRLKKVYIPFVIINIITMILYYIFLNDKYSFTNIILYASGIKLLDAVLWYVKTILIFYIAFYLLFKYLSVNKAMKMLFFISIAYPIICYFLNLGNAWYASSFNFFTGTAMVFYKDKIDKFLYERYTKCLILFSSLFFIFVFGNFHFNNNDLLKVSFCYFSSIFFIFIVIQILYKVELNNMPMLLVGTISYEVYLIHMKVYNIVFPKFNTAIYIIPYIIVVFALSRLFNKFYNNAIKKFTT